MQFRHAAIGLAIISAFTFSGPVHPAMAADCAEGHLCMWEDPGYSGSQYVDQPGNPGRYEIDWWNGDNEISSVINKTGKCVTLFADDSWQGTSYFVEKGGSRPNLEQNGFDNDAESYEIYNC